MAATAGVLAWLLVAGATVSLLMHERTLGIERAVQSANAMTLVMEEHTARTMQSVDLVLAGLADAFNLTSPRDNDPRFRALIHRRLSELPSVRAIFIIGPDGFITHDTDYPATPHVSLADRSYFKQYLADPTLMRGTSQPLQSRSDGKWFNAVTRRLDHDGAFAGVIVAAIRPQYFEALYQRMGLGAGQVIQLFYRDGRLIARYPRDDRLIGKPDAASETLKRLLPNTEEGVHVQPLDGLLARRLTSYRALEGQPLVVSLAQDTPVLLATWRKTAAAAMAGLAALALLLLALVLQFIRHHRFTQHARERRLQAEKLEALGQLTSGMAHDFRNLLAIVTTNLGLISRHASQDKRVASAVDVGQRAVERGRTLIDQMLSFARQHPLKIEAVDLRRAVTAALPMLEQAGGSGMRIATEISGPLPACRVDETQLEVALVNLVANARDAAGGSGEIRISAAPCPRDELDRRGLTGAGAFVCISVQDNGPGMTEAVRRRVLEPFFTTKGEQGTGLGLAQVYGFMQQVGGDVRIDSAPGQGTSVHLFFAVA
jgi:signal transduction histidine kinase